MKDAPGVADELGRLRLLLEEARAENALLKEKLDAALDGTGICVWEGMPASGRLRVFNYQNFMQGDMAPHFDAWLAKLHPDDRENVLANYYAHLAGKTACYEAVYRTLTPQGKICWLWDRGRVVERDAAGQPLRILGAHRDVTQEKEHEQTLAKQALHDPLTGLANRRSVLQSLETMHQQEQGYVLVILDVDHFKHFNDRHGHDIGDRVLMAIAGYLAAQLGAADHAGRWGGEEFLLVLGNVDMATVKERVRALHHELQQLRVYSGEMALSVTASFGAAEHHAHEAFSDTLWRADQALLLAKRSGRNRVCWK